jgi:hypothetical protein
MMTVDEVFYFMKSQAKVYAPMNLPFSDNAVDHVYRVECGRIYEVTYLEGEWSIRLDGDEEDIDCDFNLEGIYSDFNQAKRACDRANVEVGSCGA